MVAMSGQRVATSTSYIDVLDHVLDKGIVIDAWVQVSLVGLNLFTVDARIVVAAIETYLKHATPVRHASLLQQTAFATTHPPRTENQG